MTPLEVLLQLGTVFLGAFLAFMLENLRERRQLRGWANDDLQRAHNKLATEEKVAARLGAWRLRSSYKAELTSFELLKD